MYPQIRDMAKEDIDRVGEILFDAFTVGASKYGYDPVMQSLHEGKTWAWAMFRYSANESLVAEVENRVVGVVFLNRRGTFGGAGPMAIDPNFQEKTVTAKLMDAFIEMSKSLASIRVVQETFNVRSFSLLYAHDFLPVADLLDLFLNGTVKQSLDLHGNVSELKAKDLDEVCTYDMPRSQFDRRIDLTYYTRWGKVLVYRNQSRICGYLACLPGSGSVQLGPLLADGEDVAESLFQHALVIFKDRPCRTRVMARDRQLARTLLKLGFKLYCLSFLMVKGAWRPSQYVEAFGRFPEGV